MAISKKHDATIEMADILIVDDESANLKLLSEMLGEEGYQVRPVDSPRLAIESALKNPPDMILLDVRMPEMDGFEVCDLLKQDVRTRGIPILFIIALQDTKNRVRCFKAGGADFITTPFQEEEVLARVRTHLNLLGMQRSQAEPVTGDIVTVAMDVTESRIAEQELEQDERLARSLLNATTDMTALVDEDGTILDLNDAMVSVLGGKREELIGACIFERFSQEIAGGRREVLRQALLKRETVRYVDRPRPDAAFDIGVYPVETSAGAKGRVVVFVHDITEREQFERKLQEWEASLNEAQRMAKIGSWSWDAASREVKWSRNLYRMIGLDPKSPAPSFEDQAPLYTPESWSALKQAVERTLKEGMPYDLEVTANRTDGRQRIWAVRAEAVQNSDVQVVKLQGTAQDITDRKKAEKDLRESEEKFRRLVESVPDVIWTTDATGKTIYISENVIEYFGFNQEEIYEDPHIWLSRIHSDDADRVIREFSSLIETGKPFDIEYRIRHKDGHWIWLHDRSMSTYQKDGFTYADGLFSDISFRKQAEQDLQQSRDYLEHLINSIPDAVFSVKLPERTIEWARDSYNVLGHNPDEYIGKATEQLYSSIDEYHAFGELLRNAIRDNKDFVIAETKLRNKNGESIPVEVNTTIYREKGEPVSVISLIRDISFRKKAQEALEHSEARLKEAQRIARIGNWELDRLTDTLTWSDEIFHIFEIDPELLAASYESFINTVHPEDREMVDNAFTQSLNNRQSCEIGHRLLMPDGRIKFVHEQFETIYSPDGKPLRSAGTIQDITERKEKERIDTLMEALTPREMEVLRWIIGGKLNKQIAYELGITERTVKAHRSQIMQKTRVSSLAELVSLSNRVNILPAD